MKRNHFPSSDKITKQLIVAACKISRRERMAVITAGQTSFSDFENDVERGCCIKD